MFFIRARVLVTLFVAFALVAGTGLPGWSAVTLSDSFGAAGYRAKIKDIGKKEALYRATEFKVYQDVALNPDEGALSFKMLKFANPPEKNYDDYDCGDCGRC